MLISHHIAPILLPHAERILPHADVLIAPNGARRILGEFAQFHAIATGASLPYRGTHLFPRYLQRSLPWEDVVARARSIVEIMPDAIAWDVIHECCGIERCLWWERGRFLEWALAAVGLARQMAPGARLFLSEYRPQERWRMEWALRLMDDLAGAGAPLDGISIQLHSNLLSRQPTELEWLAPVLARSRWEVHCYEVMSFDVLAQMVPHRPPTAIAEQLQAQRYAWYRGWAERAGATLFGPWHPWDGSPERYWDDLYCHPGIWREDWSAKPGAAVFQKKSPG